MSDGGVVTLDFGLAKKVVGDAERTFNTWNETHKRKSETKLTITYKCNKPNDNMWNTMKKILPGYW